MMKLKITCFIILFLMVSVNLLNTDNFSVPQSLEDEETSNEVIVSLSSANIPGFQEGSIFTDTTLSSGYAHSCIILDDGTVSCWGRNSLGQLGDGTTTHRNTPTQTASLGTGRTAVAISSGNGHTCIILDDGSVSCWGRNTMGQLGDGTNTNRSTPTQTANLGTGRTAVAISSGDTHACALLDDGTVSCWGNNGNGELGDGTNTNRNTPTQTSSLTGRTAIAISSGGIHTCIILDNRSVSCWGDNFYGQLGDGTATDRNTSTQTSSLGTNRGAVAISTGGTHTCAILDDGSVSCWGWNEYSQLGDGTTEQRNTPTQTSSLGTNRTAVAISSGLHYTCTILDNGSVSCWGANGNGGLGDGTNTDRSTPTQTSSFGSNRTAALSERDFDGDGILNIFEDIICPIGSYESSNNSSLCIPADSGTYVDQIGQNNQTPCSAGTYNPNTGSISSSDCMVADVGYYVDLSLGTGQISQTPCSAGTYNPNTGSISSSDCMVADAGYYVATTAQSSQIACAIGTYQALTGQSSCEDADPGNYVGKTGQFNQLECLAGTYQPNVGQSSCIAASIGFYVILDGAVEQTACPLKTSTKEIGSKFASDCVIDSDDDGTIDIDDAFPLDPSEDKDTDGDGRGDNMQATVEAKQMRMIIIAVVILLAIASVAGVLVMRSGKEETESDWHQDDSLFD